MKNILVVGLGAVGTVFATFLKESGHNVYGLVRSKHSDNILKVEGIWGNHKATLDKITDSVEDLKNISFDLIILAVKSFDTERAVKQIKDLVGKKTKILLTQNGYGNYEIASNYIDKSKILIGRVIFGSKIIKPLYAHITVNADDVRIGQPENLLDDKEVLEVVCMIKHSGIPASFSRDVYKILWDKILYNCALNPLGALLECNYGTLAENKETKEIMDIIIDEIFLVAKENRISLNFKNPEDYKKHFYTNLIPPTKDHFPSMYYDLKSCKRTEIDALNGSIVKLGEKVGITPKTNLTITNFIKYKEKNQLRID